MDWQSMLFQFFGGLGIFLFVLKYMGDGLQRSAGDNLRNILNKFTSTPFRAVLAGILVTVLIQSSSGTTVLAVGLVSAGFMNLEQAIGIIMGANIGTTITAFIIGLGPQVEIWSKRSCWSTLWLVTKPCSPADPSSVARSTSPT